jgi:hypothetical protein
VDVLSHLGFGVALTPIILPYALPAGAVLLVVPAALPNVRRRMEFEPS